MEEPWRPEGTALRGKGSGAPLGAFPHPALQDLFACPMEYAGKQERVGLEYFKCYHFKFYFKYPTISLGKRRPSAGSIAVR